MTRERAQDLARVLVLPAHELERRPRLFAVLEAALPVRFLNAAEHAPDAIIAFPGADDNPLLETFAGPRLLATDDEAASVAALAGELEIVADPRLPRVLHGARLREDLTLPGVHGGAVLATLGGTPVWTIAGAVETVAIAPAELTDGEALRDRLRPGRCLAVLVLYAFLTRVLADRAGWEPPMLRAAYVIDDPNLHWKRYGYIDYPQIARHASEHGYHLAVAMVPLDGWFAHPATAGLFRRHAAHLSVVVHGNDHEGGELGRLATVPDAARLARRALTRVERFERRSGVPVSRIMVPPHERLSEAAAKGLLARDFEGVCMTRPYPWIATPGRPWLDAPEEARALAGWGPTDLIAGGLPVLLRSDFSYPREDLPLKALLGQPLILYGHHEDLSDGLGLLETATADVNRLGAVRWSPLDAIARASYSTWRADGILGVRMHARRVRIEVPPGVTTIAVASPTGPVSWRPATAADWRPIPADGRVDAEARNAIEVRVASAAVELAPPPPRRIWPAVRRLAAEARDRVRPLSIN